jgi:hypothetical protein
MPFEVTDDSGLLAIVDPDAYRSFDYSTDWTWEALERHFIGEMQERRLLIWGSGMENLWNVQVAYEQVAAPRFREITGSIAASRGRLLLTSYDSLAMVDRVTLPGVDEEHLLLSVPPGLYDCRIIQLSDPECDEDDDDDDDDDAVHFIYELTRATSPKAVWRQIPWMIDDDEA